MDNVLHRKILGKWNDEKQFQKGKAPSPAPRGLRGQAVVIGAASLLRPALGTASGAPGKPSCVPLAGPATLPRGRTPATTDSSALHSPLRLHANHFLGSPGLTTAPTGLPAPARPPGPKSLSRDGTNLGKGPQAPAPIPAAVSLPSTNLTSGVGWGAGKSAARPQPAAKSGRGSGRTPGWGPRPILPRAASARQCGSPGQASRGRPRRSHPGPLRATAPPRDPSPAAGAGRPAGLP